MGNCGLTRYLHTACNIRLPYIYQIICHSADSSQDQPPPLFRAGPVKPSNLLDFALRLFICRIEDCVKGSAKHSYDRIKYLIENAGIALSKRTLSLHGLSEKATAVQSPEDTLMEALKQQEREEMRRLLMEGLDNCLTSAQRRRLWLYFVDGLTVRQIAEAEGVQHPSIVECLAAAKKKLLEYLKRMV